MTDHELSELIDVLFAHSDCECGSCRASRPVLDAELALGRGSSELVSTRVSRIVRDRYLSDQALAQGYGLEDAAKCFDWLTT